MEFPLLTAIASDALDNAEANDWPIGEKLSDLSVAAEMIEQGVFGASEECVDQFNRHNTLKPYQKRGNSVIIKTSDPTCVLAAVMGFMSTRCDVSSQHKLPTMDEIQSTILNEFFEDGLFVREVERLISTGILRMYGPYISDREIDVM